jgi:hypothetical protein
MVILSDYKIPRFPPVPRRFENRGRWRLRRGTSVRAKKSSKGVSNEFYFKDFGKSSKKADQSRGLLEADREVGPALST